MTNASAEGMPADLAGLAGLFAVNGTLHLVLPGPYERIVPHRLPYPRELVYVCGVLELLCAAGLLMPRTRRAAGLASAALLVAVFPANVQMAIDYAQSRRSAAAKAAALVRLPLQWPMIRTAWRAFHR